MLTIDVLTSLRKPDLRELVKALLLYIEFSRRNAK